MEAKNMTIEFSSVDSNLTDIVEKNPSFDAAKLRIAYTGKNRNNTFISKESFERAIPTMFNCPLVANYIREEDEIGSHDGEFVTDQSGETKYVNITQPVGVIPESAQYTWESVNDNGVMHQYLCTDVLLWKRQEAYQKIIEDGVTSQSMEIAVNDGEMLDDYYNIKDFCFTAFCLLGNAEPCFESAALFTFSTNEFKRQYTEMMNDFKAAFSTANTTTEKEGEKDLKLKELLEKYQIAEEDLDFDTEGLSDEELEEKFIEAYESKNKKATKSDSDEDSDPVNKDEDEDVDEDDTSKEDPPADDESNNDEGVDNSDNSGTEEGSTDNSTDDTSDDGGESSEAFTLNSQLREALNTVVSEEKIETEWGAYSRRCIVDYDVEKQEVYFYDYEDDKLYGCSYTLDGDDVIIDFEKSKRKKYVIVDYIEGTEQNFSMSHLIDQFNEAYSIMTAKLCDNQAEFERLQNFEQEIIAERKESLFDQFEEKLNDSTEFKVLKSNAGDYSLDELEKELFALVGKKNFSFSATHEKKNTKPMNMPKDESAQEFGGLFSWKKKEMNEN